MIPKTHGRMLTRLVAVNDETRQQFLATLISASAAAHIHHLKTASYAQHMALESLYSDLPGLVDTVVEECLGEYGRNSNYPPVPVEVLPDADPLTFVSDLLNYVQAARYEVSDQSYIQNSIDTVCSLLSRTKYKLRDLA